MFPFEYCYNIILHLKYKQNFYLFKFGIYKTLCKRHNCICSISNKFILFIEKLFKSSFIFKPCRPNCKYFFFSSVVCCGWLFMKIENCKPVVYISTKRKTLKARHKQFNYLLNINIISFYMHIIH